jgi:predicted CoA-binding protein
MHDMDHDSYSDDEIAAILRECRVFAFIGASANTSRPSYFAMKYMLGKGYSVIPVNPGIAGKEILGQTVVGRLGDLTGQVDVIDIFRNSEAALEITREAVAMKERLGLKAIWMQLGVTNEEAARLAENAGLKVIMNRCPKIEYGRLSGEIGWAGINSGRISSVRPQLAPTGVQSQIIDRGSPAQVAAPEKSGS